MKRFVFIVAILAYFGGTIFWIASDRRISRQAFDAYSIANTGNEGLSRAYKYLGRTGRRTGMLTKPLRARMLEPNAVLFRVGIFVSPFLEQFKENFEEEQRKAQEKLKEEQRKRDAAKGKKPAPKPTPKVEPKSKRVAPLISDEEEAFVRGGGRLIIAVAGDAGPLAVRGHHDKTAKKVFPMFPGVDTIILPEARGYELRTLEPRMHALFTGGEHVIMARQSIGAGDLIFIATPELFQNQNLTGSRVSLLLALAGTKRPVYFDEAVHGLVSDDGMVEMMKEWGLGPFLLLGALATALLFWRRGQRVGPPDEEPREKRSDAVDLVGSLGALYQRSMKDAEALSLYHESLTRTVAASSGLRGDALHKRVADLTGNAVFPKPGTSLASQEFGRMLTIINDAFQKLERRHGGN